VISVFGEGYRKCYEFELANCDATSTSVEFTIKIIEISREWHFRTPVHRNSCVHKRSCTHTKEQGNSDVGWAWDFATVSPFPSCGTIFHFLFFEIKWR
jgi:hypothetical protein